MRPTTALRRASLAFDVGPGPKRSQPAPEFDVQKILTGLIAQRNKARKTLVEIRQAQSSGKVTRAITDKVNALKRALRQPPQAVKGALVVRVLGVTKHAGEAVRLPLAGLAVRAKAADKVVAEAETNAAGIALIAPDRDVAPDGGGKDDEDEAKRKPRGATHVIEVLAPDGGVAAVKKVADTSSPVLIELGETAALIGAFTAAHPWLKARDAVTARAAEIKARNTKALKRLVKELEKTIARLDTAIERAAKRKGGKDGDHTEGEKPVRSGGVDKGGRRPRNGRRRQ